MASGIYMIKNILTNKVYIGSTIDFERRFYLHKINLRRNKDGLQSSDRFI